jgi:hypothetical protein
MNRLFSGAYKLPPIKKQLRKQYSLGRRYLATSLHEIELAKNVLLLIDSLNEEFDDVSDSEDEEEILDSLIACEDILVDLVYERVDDPAMQPCLSVQFSTGKERAKR